MWTAYLELLARDAPAVEYEAPVLTARADGQPSEVIAQLEEGKRLALQVRESLLTKARREDELTALYDTAYDLARLSDLDSVLEAIVHRARQLGRRGIGEDFGGGAGADVDFAHVAFSIPYSTSSTARR